MVFIPWSILPLRIYTQWALDYAHIMIPCYAAFMIFSGIFTVLAYSAGKVKNNAMKVCLVINRACAVFGIAAIIMITAQSLSPAIIKRNRLTNLNSRNSFLRFNFCSCRFTFIQFPYSILLSVAPIKHSSVIRMASSPFG